jgi:hypothetical protein
LPAAFWKGRDQPHCKTVEGRQPVPRRRNARTVEAAAQCRDASVRMSQNQNRLRVAMTRKRARDQLSLAAPRGSRDRVLFYFEKVDLRGGHRRSKRKHPRLWRETRLHWSRVPVPQFPGAMLHGAYVLEPGVLSCRAGLGEARANVRRRFALQAVSESLPAEADLTCASTSASP